MSKGYFVTGTDTGIGKTTVSCAMLRTFAGQGLRAVGMKPVSSGCVRSRHSLVSEDVLLLRAAGNVDAPAALVNPYAFEPPLAPHIAAAQAGVTIRMPVMTEAFGNLANLADVVVVEGVGGFRVPLNANEDTADLAVALNLPVILVVGMRLGCINHALLTAEAILGRGLDLAGWVANCVDPEMQAIDQNLQALQERLPAPLAGIVDYQSATDGQSTTLGDFHRFNCAKNQGNIRPS